MPQPKQGPRLASSPAHERLMLANMATSLFEYGRIKTTVKKAKRLQPLAERLITFAKQDDLSARRRIARIIRNKSVAHKLFTEIAKQMKEREGGYTRIIKVMARQGDNAPMAVIELVTEPVSKKPDVKKVEKIAEAKKEEEVAKASEAAVVRGAADEAIKDAVNAGPKTAAEEYKAAEDLEAEAEKDEAEAEEAEEEADIAEEAVEAAKEASK
ncbi:MAG: 50S ribosomal protein L17 [Bifidobacteriaceae bacterium]|nr:50S ribosomal protein L17 [Aeriscardovia sp.]MEE1324174.1 50S ribosomal protein L17 [Bifidobacteriaceae bacterium]